MTCMTSAVHLYTGIGKSRNRKENEKRQVGRMEIYRVKNSDMMGFTISELFFSSKEKAIQTFMEKMDEYRSSELLAKNEEVQEHNLSTESISFVENHPDKIKSAMVCLWYKCSHEYNEWDITVEHLDLEIVQVEE